MWPDWLTTAWWHQRWDDFVQFISDLPIVLLKKFLDAVLSVLNMVDVPTFVTQYKLADVMAAANIDMGYFLYNSGVSAAVGIIASAVIFRVFRKFFTLGWW